MAIAAPTIPLTGLAKCLVSHGLLSEIAAADAWQEAQRTKAPFITQIVANKLCAARDIAQVAAYEFGYPLLDISLFELDKDIVKRVADNLIRKHNILPLYKRGNKLFIAIADPTNIAAVDEIKFHTGSTVEPVLVEADKLAKTIESALEAASAKLNDMVKGDLDGLEGLDVSSGEDPAAAGDGGDSEVDDAPVVRFVNGLLLDALKKGASDLHLEPYEKFYRVRFRIDGMLNEIARPPIAFAHKIAARIKVMSRLNTAERRVPQDGRIKLKLSQNKSIDFRVSTCPTLFGEKCVLRILNSDAAALNIDQLGYEDFQKQIFLDKLHKPYGMFLVTGPTGSGKTVSLYTGINILNTTGVNISTAEDPVEINLPGINQVQVDERTGMTFAKALKSFLRQDPDIILVGEIRDLETASIGVKAAQTGHMVMSTLHTNDAPQTLTRLMDMGIAPFAIATSINLITAQRLARRLCPQCKQPHDMPSKALLAEGFAETDVKQGVQIFKANPEGCPSCNKGYKGRTGLYQVMPITDAMKRLIIEGANAVKLADQARNEGIPDIRQAGLKKVRDGVTSIEEINRVTIVE